MELQRRKREAIDLEVEGPMGPFATDNSNRGATVTICHGIYAEELPVAGQTVGRIRSLYADRFDMDPQSQAVIDGNEVDDDTTVDAGQLLLFVRQAGEKGINGSSLRDKCL